MISTCDSAECMRLLCSVVVDDEDDLGIKLLAPVAALAASVDEDEKLCAVPLIRPKSGSMVL